MPRVRLRVEQRRNDLQTHGVGFLIAGRVVKVLKFAAFTNEVAAHLERLSNIVTQDGDVLGVRVAVEAVPLDEVVVVITKNREF